jgi:hypothetical protein
LLVVAFLALALAKMLLLPRSWLPVVAFLALVRLVQLLRMRPLSSFLIQTNPLAVLPRSSLPAAL